MRLLGAIQRMGDLASPHPLQVTRATKQLKHFCLDVHGKPWWHVQNSSKLIGKLASYDDFPLLECKVWHISGAHVKCCSWQQCRRPGSCSKQQNQNQNCDEPCVSSTYQTYQKPLSSAKHPLIPSWLQLVGWDWKKLNALFHQGVCILASWQSSKVCWLSQSAPFAWQISQLPGRLCMQSLCWKARAGGTLEAFALGK